MKIISEKRSFEKIDEKWDKTFHLWNTDIRIGISKDSNGSSIFIERRYKKGEYIYLRQYILKKINNGERIRLSYHTRKKTLKKLF